MKQLIAALIVCSFVSTSFARDWLRIEVNGKEKKINEIFGGKKAKEDGAKGQQEFEKKDINKIPALKFHIDERWPEWFSNKVELAEMEQSAREKKDFLEIGAIRFKRAYANFFKTNELQLNAISASTTNLMTKKEAAIKRRENQAKFDNKIAVAQIDAEIKGIEHSIEENEKRMNQDPNRLVFDFIADREHYVGAIALGIACRPYTGNPLPADWVDIKRLREYRESLANAAAQSPEAVQEKALALNSQLKTIEENLLKGNPAEAQRVAMNIVNALLD